MWSRLSKDYPAIEGMGLDAREGTMGGGDAMEINTVPSFEMKTQEVELFIKIPQLQFPVDAQGGSVLVQNETYYSKDALFAPVKEWKNSGAPVSGAFSETHFLKPAISPRKISLDQGAHLNARGARLGGLESVVETIIKESKAFGWISGTKVPGGEGFPIKPTLLFFFNRI